MGFIFEHTHTYEPFVQVGLFTRFRFVWTNHLYPLVQPRNWALRHMALQAQYIFFYCAWPCRRAMPSPIFYHLLSRFLAVTFHLQIWRKSTACLQTSYCHLLLGLPVGLLPAKRMILVLILCELDDSVCIDSHIVVTCYQTQQSAKSHSDFKQRYCVICRRYSASDKMKRSPMTHAKPRRFEWPTAQTHQLSLLRNQSYAYLPLGTMFFHY